MEEEEKYLITAKQINALKFIGVFITENGYSPSYRDICAGTGIKSTSTVKSVVDFLVMCGCIKKPYSRAFRSISVTDFGRHCLKEHLGWETTQAIT